MPYRMGKKDGKWCIFNKDTGENKGCSDSRAKAVAHMRALYAVEGGAKMGKKELDNEQDVMTLVDEWVRIAEEEFDAEQQQKQTEFTIKSNELLNKALDDNNPLDEYYILLDLGII